MSNISIFEILEPIMIGPSSSHTAGAEKLGKAARAIAGEAFDAVEFHLHGSFAHTYLGHGTDKALVAGILGLEADDERLKDSFAIAEKMGIQVSFREADLGEVHPNTAKIVLKSHGQTMVTVIGSSIGGGNIIINEIDSDKLDIDGRLPVCIIKHKDVKGMINQITSVIAKAGVNIATLKVARENKGDIATTILETDGCITAEKVEEISAIENVISVRMLDVISK